MWISLWTTKRLVEVSCDTYYGLKTGGGRRSGVVRECQSEGSSVVNSVSHHCHSLHNRQYR